MSKRPASAMSPEPSEAPTLQSHDEQKQEKYQAEKRPKFHDVSNHHRRTLFPQPPSNSVGNHDKKRKVLREQQTELARRYRRSRQYSGNATVRQARFNLNLNSAQDE